MVLKTVFLDVEICGCSRMSYQLNINYKVLNYDISSCDLLFTGLNFVLHVPNYRYFNH